MAGITIQKEEQTLQPPLSKSGAKPSTLAQSPPAHALFNCLVKEFALPQGLIRYQWPKDRDRLPVEITHASGHIVPMHVFMPDQSEFFVLVDRKSGMGSQYYLSHIYGKLPGGRWKQLDPELLAARLLSSCAAPETPVNGELLKQIQSSITLSEEIALHAETVKPDPFRDYIASEQNLWFGHPSHPAPKARLWPDNAPVARYSPEFSPQVRMHVLEVPSSGLNIRTDETSHSDVLDGIADQSNCPPGYARISLHPVQARLFLGNPRVERLLRAGMIRDLGETGFHARPTASIRTMYIEGHDYFIKGSLNIRITNCVRKNAWYELESTIRINRLLRELTSTAAASTGGLNLIEEPATISWSPEGADPEDDIWFREQTGAILRRNFCKTEGAEQCVIAATLFARDLDLQSNSTRYFARWKLDQDDRAKLEWFTSYLKALLKPVLFLFYNHGIVMEPHLQNTVIVHENGHVARLLLRDYEGVKLTSDKGISHIDATVHPTVRQSMEYSRQAGWQRISYCLFVNNLSEAILALSENSPGLANTMWQQVRRELHQISRDLHGPTPEIDQLIASGEVACKTNFKVRLAAQADRNAGYVTLKAPWHSEECDHE